jgi:hypothetical protein
LGSINYDNRVRQGGSQREEWCCRPTRRGAPEDVYRGQWQRCKDLAPLFAQISVAPYELRNAFPRRRARDGPPVALRRTE